MSAAERAATTLRAPPRRLLGVDAARVRSHRDDGDPHPADARGRRIGQHGLPDRERSIGRVVRRAGRKRPRSGSGGTTPPRGLLAAAAAGTLARACVLLLVGLQLGGLRSGVAVILVFYALLFVVAVPFLALPARVLLPLAAAWAVLAPVLSQAIRPFMPMQSFDSSAGTRRPGRPDPRGRDHRVLSGTHLDGLSARRTRYRQAGTGQPAGPARRSAHRCGSRRGRLVGVVVVAAPRRRPAGARGRWSGRHAVGRSRHRDRGNDVVLRHDPDLDLVVARGRSTALRPVRPAAHDRHVMCRARCDAPAGPGGATPPSVRRDRQHDLHAVHAARRPARRHCLERFPTRSSGTC